MQANNPILTRSILNLGGVGVDVLAENGSVTLEQADAADIYYNGAAVAVMPLQAAAAAIELISSSGVDDVGGTGALTVEVGGLDGSYNWVTETFTLTGAVAVVGTQLFMRVMRMIVLTAGTGLTNAGNIDAQAVGGGQVWDRIVALEGRNQHSLITVPAGKTLWVVHWVCSFNALIAAEIHVKHRPYEGAWLVHDKRFCYLGGEIGEQHLIQLPEPIPAKTDIKMYVSVGGACKVSSHMRGFLTNDTFARHE